MTKARRITEYVRDNILRFLLLAVCLTLCLAMRYAALGKYVSIIEESTQAVAGDFYFRSNYLREGTPKTYDIVNWERTGDKVAFEIRNYNNSLKFNKTNKDFFYYVTAEYYADAGCTTTIADDGVDLKDYEIELDVHYGDPIADMDINNPEHEEDSWEFGTGTTTTCALLAGGNPVAQTVYVYIEPTSETNPKINETLYLKVTAHTIPLNQIDIVKSKEDGTKYGNASNVEGVFNSEISAIFALGSTTSSADVTKDVTDNKEGLDLTIKLVCRALEHQGIADVKVYYNYDHIYPTELYVPLEDPDYKDPEVEEVSAEYLEKHPYPDYISVQINSGGSDSLRFLKHKMDSYNKEDVKIVVVIKETSK